MADESEAGQLTEGFWQSFAKGGLLRFVASQPVQEAIGRLVSGTADIPVAWLEGVSKRIRADTAAREAVTAAVANVVKAKAAEDPELIERGVERWTRQLGRRQRAREDVATRTLLILGESELPLEAAPPSDEFMDMFEGMAEGASSEALADLMARILAGEIRKPGSVSRRTLQVVTILDQEIVSALDELKPFLIDPGWFYIPQSLSRQWRPILDLLESVSITNQSGPRIVEQSSGNIAFFGLGDEGVFVTCKPAPFKWQIDGANLTPIGKELVAVLPLTGGRRTRELAITFKEHRFAAKVEIGKLVQGPDGSWSGIDLREID